MRVFNGFEHTALIPRPVVTIGSYDGVHRGHREILSHLKALARARKGESVVVTFHPHPRLVLGRGEGLRLLTTLPEKLELLEQAGIDNVIVAPFTESFSKLGAEEFIRDYLVETLHLDTLTVGYNHHLGHNQQGDPGSLERLAHKFGFRLEKMPQQRVDDRKVSSTVIRELVSTGRLEEAARYLGSPYRISGILSPQGVLEGIEPLKLLPPPGEYRVSLRRVLSEPGDFASIPAIIEIGEEPPVTINPGQGCLCKALSGTPWQHTEVRAEFQ